MFDAIVLGTGGVGSAALYELARLGLNVLGIDRFTPGHDRGSSHGHSRIIRRSYFEHPGYVPLLNSAYECWDLLASRHSRDLFRRTGVVYFVSPNGPVHTGVMTSATQYGLHVDELTTEEAVRQFPGFVAPEGTVALYERDAGMLFVEECVRAFVKDAVNHGAHLKHGEPVVDWTADGGDVVVRTKRQEYRARRLIVTAGSWACQLLSDLNLPLEIRRKHMHWFASDGMHHRLEKGSPCFFTEALGGYFYGFPDDGQTGVKVAEHSGGAVVSDPLSDDRAVSEADLHRVNQFRQMYLRGVSSRSLSHQVCYYTMTPDEHFIVDRHPDFPNVVFAAGLSGHGYKFAPVLGQILAKLACEQEPPFDLEFLRLSRPALHRD